jgi:hypothetical protein
VAKSKYSPALFEVINRQRNTGKLGVPKWWKGLGGSGEQPADPDAPPATGEEPQMAAADQVSDQGQPIEATVAESAPMPRAEPVPAAASREADEPAEPRPAADRGRRMAGPPDRAPWLRFDAGRFCLALTPVQAAVIPGILLIVLVIGFQMGRGFRGSPSKGTADPMTAMLNQSPTPGVVESPGGTGSPAAPVRATAGPGDGGKTGAAPDAGKADEELKPGMLYILCDRYPKDKVKSAQFVKQWLWSKHQIATTLRGRKDSYVLIATKGFDKSEDQKAEEFRLRIKALSGECRNELIRARLDVYCLASPLIVVGE